MPSFHICTHVGGYVVDAPDEATAVDALSNALIASDDGQPTFAHEVVHVEAIDPTTFDFEEAHLVGDRDSAPPAAGLPEGVRITHWSRDPAEDEAA